MAQVLGYLCGTKNIMKKAEQVEVICEARDVLLVALDRGVRTVTAKSIFRAVTVYAVCGNIPSARASLSRLKMLNAKP